MSSLLGPRLPAVFISGAGLLGWNCLGTAKEAEVCKGCQGNRRLLLFCDPVASSEPWAAASSSAEGAVCWATDEL